MTALIITGSVLLLLAILLAAPISVEITYGEQSLEVCLHYLFLRFNLSPGLLEKKTGLGKRKKTTRKEKPAEETEGSKDKGALYAVESVWELLKNSRKGFGILRRHLIFSRVKVLVAVGGEDAAEIALRCAQLNTAALAALDLLGTLFVLRTPTVAIAPVFTAQSTRMELALRAGIRPVYVLRVWASVLYHFLRHVNENKKNPPPNKAKGGKQHERAASRQ